MPASVNPVKTIPQRIKAPNLSRLTKIYQRKVPLPIHLPLSISCLLNFYLFLEFAPITRRRSLSIPLFIPSSRPRCSPSFKLVIQTMWPKQITSSVIHLCSHCLVFQPNHSNMLLMRLSLPCSGHAS